MEETSNNVMLVMVTVLEEDMYVQVMCDFCYTLEDEEISIKEGEELLVVDNSFPNWWQVIRHFETYPFYAPSSYLKLIKHHQCNCLSQSLKVDEKVGTENILFSGVCNVTDKQEISVSSKEETKISECTSEHSSYTPSVNSYTCVVSSVKEKHCQREMENTVFGASEITNIKVSSLKNSIEKKEEVKKYMEEDYSKSIIQSTSNKNNSEDVCHGISVEKKKKIRNKLWHFFLKRPTVEDLKEKGIILDGGVFGCQLENLCHRENRLVPKFVAYCIETIEKKELTADGLYRASGNLSQVQKIRFRVNQDDYRCLEEESDVHVLTGALKMFFREMKEPLFPFHMYNDFLQAMALSSNQSRVAALKELVQKMPDCNQKTLRFLLQHLLRVTDYHRQNRMQVQNLAIVFGPTLMWPEQESSNIALEMMHQNRIVELLLLEFEAIFV